MRNPAEFVRARERAYVYACVFVRAWNTVRFATTTKSGQHCSSRVIATNHVGSSPKRETYLAVAAMWSGHSASNSSTT